MDGNDKQSQLRRLTDTLLDPAASGEAILSATRELNALFDALSPIQRPETLERGPDTALEGGVAVSPACAAECGLEPLRVCRFLQGLRRAIDDALERFAPGPVHLLYAGTGPYATLVTPLLTRYTPERLRVTLLDYHGVSLESVRAILQALGLAGFVKGYVEADATTYRHPADDPIHVVVSETMAAGLANEMQVPITLNLAPQLAEGGLWVPEKIRVKAVTGDPRTLLLNVDRGAPPPYPPLREIEELGVLFQIGAEEGRALAGLKDAPHLPAAEITIPELLPAGHTAFLTTEIDVYGDIALTDRDSTLNHILGFPAGADGAAGSTTQFIYRLGKHPGLEGVTETSG